jgi:GxxExxY protein
MWLEIARMDLRGEQIEAFEGAWTGMRGVDVPDELNQLTHAAIGAAMRVHSSLGPGLPERLYAAALAIELDRRGIRFAREVPVCVRYEGHELGELRLDLVVSDSIVVELKAVEAVHDLHLAQLVSYLKAGQFPLGVLINFNVPVLKDGIYRRVHSRALARAAPP